jgi:hypothetical protein
MTSDEPSGLVVAIMAEMRLHFAHELDPEQLRVAAEAAVKRAVRDGGLVTSLVVPTHRTGVPAGGP